MAFGEDTFGNLFRFGGGWGNISGPGLLYVYSLCLRFTYLCLPLNVHVAYMIFI